MWWDNACSSISTVMQGYQVWAPIVLCYSAVFDVSFSELATQHERNFTVFFSHQNLQNTHMISLCTRSLPNIKLQHIFAPVFANANFRVLSSSTPVFFSEVSKGTRGKVSSGKVRFKMVHHPSAMRNREPIAEKLQEILPQVRFVQVIIFCVQNMVHTLSPPHP